MLVELKALKAPPVSVVEVAVKPVATAQAVHAPLTKPKSVVVDWSTVYEVTPVTALHEILTKSLALKVSGPLNTEAGPAATEVPLGKTATTQ